MNGLCVHCQGKHMGRTCKWARIREGSCCKTCGFPQRLFGERIHGDIGTGECEKGLKDLIKGVCWGIFRRSEMKEMKKKYLETVGMNMEDEERYKEWLNDLDRSGEMLNGCRLLLNIWRDRNEE